MSELFDWLFNGLAWLLDFFYRLYPSYGFAIVLLTIAVMGLAFPLTAKSTRSMAAMSKLQPELQRIKQKYPDDRQKQSEETFALMKEHGASPFGGCLPVLVQMPVFIIMYQLIYNLTRKGDGGNFNPKYLAEDSTLRDALESAGGEMISFGIDLAKNASDVLNDSFLGSLPFLGLIGIAVGTAYFQQYQVSRRNAGQPQQADNPYMQQMQRMMKIMPLMYLFFGFTLPAGVVVYMVASNLFRIAQQALLYKMDPSLRTPAGAAVRDKSGGKVDPPAPKPEKAPKPKPTPSAKDKGTSNGKPGTNGQAKPSGRVTPKKKKGR